MDGIDACCKTHDGCYKGFGSLASYYLINDSTWNCMNDPSSTQYKYARKMQINRDLSKTLQVIFAFVYLILFANRELKIN